MQRRDFFRRTALGAAAVTFPSVAAASPRRPGAHGLRVQQGPEIYVNPVSGADDNAGGRSAPLRTLAEAARRVNLSSGTGPLTIVLTEGSHTVAETALFRPERRTFTGTDRLTIRAEVLPDDPEWHTGRMPTLIHTLPLQKTWNGRPVSDGAVDGMLIETSHVSILGLKLLGMPVVETPLPGQILRLYGISRLDRSLEDLQIGHCVFAGDTVTNPFHVAVIAHGNGVNVHHCIFHGVKITIVYWSGGSTGHALTNTVINRVYGSGVWTASVADDFVFRNNVVTESAFAWTYQSTASAATDENRGNTPPAVGGAAAGQPAMRVERTYQVVDSHFSANEHLAGSGTGASLGYREIDSSFLKLVNTKVTQESTPIERDQSKRSYLHPVAGSEAAGAGAGLFSRPPV